MREITRNVLMFGLITCTLTVSLVSLNRALRARAVAATLRDRAERIGQTVNQRQKDIMHVKMLRLAAIVKNSLRPMGKDDFEKAIHIRDHIHHNVPTQFASECFSMDFDDMYVASMRDEKGGHLCGGLALFYVASLESQGIPARYVGIFSDDKEPYVSHATVEFWFNGKWHASDPFTNMMFMSNGEYLSYAEVYHRVREGIPFEVSTNGHSILPERKVDNYPTVLAGFMKFMVIHPSDVWRGNKLSAGETDMTAHQVHSAELKPGDRSTIQLVSRSESQPNLSNASTRGNLIRYPMQLFPKTWDGAITFRDGERRDVRAFSGIYAYLGEGPLR